jgi:hypothetical protein
MSKEVKIKSNGLRNELKEIRKSIDKLTSAMIEIHIAQTNKHYEKDNTSRSTANACVCGKSNKTRKES